MERPLRIGTRASPLALAQAHMVAAALRESHQWPDEAVEIVPITTSGDRIQDRPLADVGGKALWTKELDRCLLDGRTDLSVHSMKDVETFRPAELRIVAMLKRADPRDRLIGALSLEALAPGSLVGTSSPRRAAQILARRPDLRVESIRGNVQTRLAKLEAGEVDATLLAAAGLDRVGLHQVGTFIPAMIPAPSQGAIGIEVAANRYEVAKLVAAVDHADTHRAVMAERDFLAALGGNCHSAVAAHATVSGGVLHLEAEILMPDGSEVQAGRGDDPAALARRLMAQASPALRACFDG